MNKKKLKPLERKITKIKNKIFQLKTLRPGTLIERYTVCGKKTCKCIDAESPRKHGPYAFVVHTRKGKTNNTFVKHQNVELIKQQIQNYNQLRFLVDEWIELGLEYSKIEIEEKNKVN